MCIEVDRSRWVLIGTSGGVNVTHPAVPSIPFLAYPRNLCQRFPHNYPPLSLYLIMTLPTPNPGKNSGVSPFSTMKKESTFASQLNSPHVVPTLCSSESHALIQDALMCKDSSVSHLVYGLPVPKVKSWLCSTPEVPPEWHIYEDPLTTTSSTALSQSQDSWELNLSSSEIDPLTVDDLTKEEQRSWPGSLSLLENRPSRSLRTRNAKRPGVSRCDLPEPGTPSWRSYRLIGTEWCPLPSSSFTVHPALERPN